MGGGCSGRLPRVGSALQHRRGQGLRRQPGPLNARAARAAEEVSADAQALGSVPPERLCCCDLLRPWQRVAPTVHRAVMPVDGPAQVVDQRSLHLLLHPHGRLFEVPTAPARAGMRDPMRLRRHPRPTGARIVAQHPVERTRGRPSQVPAERWFQGALGGIGDPISVQQGCIGAMDACRAQSRRCRQSKAAAWTGGSANTTASNGLGWRSLPACSCQPSALLCRPLTAKDQVAAAPTNWRQHNEGMSGTGT